MTDIFRLFFCLGIFACSRIHHQKSRYLYDLFYRRKAISRGGCYISKSTTISGISKKRNILWHASPGMFNRWKSIIGNPIDSNRWQLVNCHRLVSGGNRWPIDSHNKIWPLSSIAVDWRPYWLFPDSSRRVVRSLSFWRCQQSSNVPHWSHGVFVCLQIISIRHQLMTINSNRWRSLHRLQSIKSHKNLASLIGHQFPISIY